MPTRPRLHHHRILRSRREVYTGMSGSHWVIHLLILPAIAAFCIVYSRGADIGVVLFGELGSGEITSEAMGLRSISATRSLGRSGPTPDAPARVASGLQFRRARAGLRRNYPANGHLTRCVPIPGGVPHVHTRKQLGNLSPRAEGCWPPVVRDGIIVCTSSTTCQSKSVAAPTPRATSINILTPAKERTWSAHE